MSDEEEKIRKFLTRQFLFEFDEAITADSDLFELGLVDSYGFVELVTFLESEFAIQFTEDEIVDGGLNTLAGITAAVSAKVARREP